LKYQSFSAAVTTLWASSEEGEMVRHRTVFQAVKFFITVYAERVVVRINKYLHKPAIFWRSYIKHKSRTRVTYGFTRHVRKVKNTSRVDR